MSSSKMRRYIYSPRDGQDLNLSSKEKRLSLLNQSRNLTIELDKSIEQPKKKSKKNDKSQFKELIPKSPTTTANTPINDKKKNRKQKKKISPRRSIFNKSLSSKSIDSLKALKRALNKSLNKMNQNKKYKNSFNSSSEKVIKKKKRQHSLEVSSENAVKKKRRKIEPFVTSTPLNKGIVKRVNRRKNKNKKNKTVHKDQTSIYNPEYHLHSTLKLSENRELTDNRDIIDITSPQPKNHPFVTLSETPINQHLSINLTPNIYKKLALNMPDIIEIDDDEEVQTPGGPEIDYVNLLSPSVNGDESVKDDDSCIIIDDTPNKTAGTQMTPRSSYHHDRVIEIGTQITPHQTNVSTNTSKFTYSQVVGTKSVQTVTTSNNNVVTQSTSTSITQISKNLHQSTSPAQKKQPKEQQQQRITPQNFNFQQNNGVISDFVQRIKQLEDQFIKHALLPQNEQNTQNNQTNSNYNPKFGSNIYNPKQVVKRGLRLIVIDGSNVAMGHSNGKYFSCEGLKICIDYFLKRGHEVKAFVPQYRRQHHQSSNPELLEHLAKCNLVIFTPSRQVNGRLIIPYDDRYIVQCAAERGGVIVSNDNYRDLLAENPAWRETITKRLLMWTWCGDMIMFPIDPCGRGGPSLDSFLRF
ncbi:NEDD4-binding protein 1-like [Chrysoperla carnea]|uniref:NEDD4-binding protein 1-like n=1 Tax=Chrysoperla carnea TaxID=189513 RepID=UPI001D0677D9|nr:NEDD4-binding protein 1-like [Chrysoperla carnea]